MTKLPLRNNRFVCNNTTNSQMTLTKTEHIVSLKILEGKSNQEIASELNVSINTIKSHVAHILKKHNVKTRIQLISNQLK